ncbi:MAG TPA: TetR/AcrR family transcriptional regulator [Actinobacteria bacterium]|nr:putative HTH-type transcriptional regulator YxaF [bacterium BMS3Bbin02]HDL42227.1 TetR/AcrR family transcriptional regulator [Actinomycetota bacterium]
MGYAKSTETKHRLLRNTGRLLRTRGFSATGVTDILTTSGVPRGSLYHHFPDGKEQIAAGAIEQSGHSIVYALREMIKTAGSLADGIQQFCDYYISELEASGYARGCPLATVALETSATENPVQQQTAAAFEAIIAVVADQLLREGFDEPHDLAVVVVATVEGALVLAKATRNTEHLAIVRDHIQNQITAAAPQSKE